jgi:hypothetical protein
MQYHVMGDSPQVNGIYELLNFIHCISLHIFWAKVPELPF